MTAFNLPPNDKEEANEAPSTTSAIEPAKADSSLPPDGGIEAWLQVTGGFCLFFNTWGILNTFGVFQTYYESGDLFIASSSQISWIGSITAFLLLLSGLFAGPVYDKGFLRLLLVLGSFLVVLGLMMLSLATQYYQALLAQGFAIGIGTGCLFVPTIAIIPQWFSRKLGMAVGIAVSGSALGGVIYPIVLYRLIDEIGFAWAVRVVGFIALGTLSIPVTLTRQRVPSPKVRAFLDPSAFTDATFMCFCFAAMINFMGVFTIFFYLSYYGQASGITDTSLSFYLVSIFCAGSFFGRLIPNIIADRIGPFNLLAPAALISGTLILCMMAVKSIAGIVIIAVIAGFSTGALIGLPPLCLVALAQAQNKMHLLGTRMGMCFAITSFGVLASGPSSGAILGYGQELNWEGVWLFGGITTIASGFCYLAMRIWIYGFRLNKA